MKDKQHYITLGEWLKTVRLQRGLSLRKLAETAGISHTTIDKIERGGGIRDDTLTLLVGALSETPEEKERLLLDAKAALAGLPPRNPEVDELAQRILRLSTGDQRMVQAMIDRLSPPQDPQD